MSESTWTDRAWCAGHVDEPLNVKPIYLQLYSERPPARWRRVASRVPCLRRLLRFRSIRHEIALEAPVVDGVAVFSDAPEISGTFTITWDSRGMLYGEGHVTNTIEATAHVPPTEP